MIALLQHVEHDTFAWWEQVLGLVVIPLILFAGIALAWRLS